MQGGAPAALGAHEPLFAVGKDKAADPVAIVDRQPAENRGGLGLPKYMLWV